MRRGVSLLELVIAITLLGLLVAFAIPPARALRDRLAVDDDARALAGAHARARLVAVAERRVMVLTLTPDSLVLRAVESATDTVERWRGVLPGTGVRLTGLPRQVVYAPSGSTLGFANGTYTISRGTARKQVVVSRYGRVRII
jgi:prepilin-type N-terminal cleavage/methylation domain-containing protein